MKTKELVCNRKRKDIFRFFYVQNTNITVQDMHKLVLKILKLFYILYTEPTVEYMFYCKC